MLNKKADTSILFMIFEIMIVLLIVGTSFQVATKFASSETVEKVSVANDFALLMNAFVASPGNAQLEFPKDLSAYTITLNQDFVLVYIDGDSEALRVRRNFYLPRGYTAFGAVENEANVCLIKERKALSLDAC